MNRPASARRARLAAALAAAVFTTAGLGAFAPAALAQDKPVSLRLTSNGPPKSPWAVQIERLAAKMAEESQGTVKIEPFFGGQLGNEQDTIQQIARGRIDMGVFAIGAVSLLAPELQLPILPFYFTSVAEQDCVIDRHLAKPIDELLAAKGVKLLGFGEVGGIDLVGKRAFADVRDVKGIKAVSYSKNQAMMWTALGANSTFVGVPEWSSSLQSGLVDAVGAPVSLYVPGGLNKVAPVLTRLQMWNTPALTVINKSVYDRLSDAQRAAFQRTMEAESATKWRAEIRGLEDKLRAAHAAGGGQIVEATPAQRDAWRAAVAPAWPEMVKSMGGQAESLFKTIDTARAACKG
jgi:TRAP-type C4-dicarboxylate transport system substrate-binding protein